MGRVIENHGARDLVVVLVDRVGVVDLSGHRIGVPGPHAASAHDAGVVEARPTGSRHVGEAAHEEAAVFIRPMLPKACPAKGLNMAMLGMYPPPKRWIFMRIAGLLRSARSKRPA